ncbi:hypothetical protein [Comamonas odontotermitis]|uniref:hypothetical protein n=1 Tax=Comamonas odontotermitis TaxID=379895 RepID=UPI001CC7F4DA|nr:hypothetical protein [Comamonas odontotermitis]UBB15361.1 hypothetical protein LAD35_10770 [Comamonas odontotermitis]
MVWRRNLDQGRLQARESGKEEQPKMKPKRRSAEPLSTVVADAEKILREENDRLRAEVAYLKKLHALIRSKMSAAPTKRA